MRLLQKSTLIFTLLLVLVFVSCKGEVAELSVADIVEDVWAYSLDNPDGFTIEIPSLDEVTSGYVVGCYLGQENVGKESLTLVVTHAMENDKVVGGWLDTDDSVYYFDSIKVFDDNQKDQADDFARDNYQKAYYDLTNDQTILVEY